MKTVTELESNFNSPPEPIHAFKIIVSTLQRLQGQSGERD